MKVVAVDRDQEAINWARSSDSPFFQALQSGRMFLFKSNFKDFFSRYEEKIQALTQGQGFDLMLLDLGVSSPQLDQAARGFSFYQDGPLDMRMDQDQQFTAADLINHFDEEELIEVFQEFGEIRRPHRVVKALLEQRGVKPFLRTGELAALIEKTEGWRAKGRNPSTRYFLALRLKVNQELEGLGSCLEEMTEFLAEGGRLMVISFHSLEDRIVKTSFKQSPKGFLVNKKVIQAPWSEQKQNPRARSAKLRVFQKGEKR